MERDLGFHLQVGEKVTAFSNDIVVGHRPTATSLIAKVNTKFFTLENGTRWACKNGYQWGHGGGGWGRPPRVEAFKPEHDDYLEVVRLARKMELTAQGLLSKRLSCEQVAKVKPWLECINDQQLEETRLYVDALLRVADEVERERQAARRPVQR